MPDSKKTALGGNTVSKTVSSGSVPGVQRTSGAAGKTQARKVAMTPSESASVRKHSEAIASQAKTVLSAANSRAQTKGVFAGAKTGTVSKKDAPKADDKKAAKDNDPAGKGKTENTYAERGSATEDNVLDETITSFSLQEEELLRHASSEIFSSAGRRRTLFFFIGLLLLAAMLVSAAVFCLNKFQKLSDSFYCDMLSDDATRLASLTRERLDAELYHISGAAAALNNGNGDPQNAISSVSTEEGTYAGIVSFDGNTVAGKALNIVKYPEIAQVFHGHPTIGFYPDLGMLFCYPVFSGANVRYCLYKVIKPLFLDRFMVDRLNGDGRMVIRNQYGIVVRPRSNDQKLLNFFNSSLARTVMVELKDLRQNRPSAAMPFKNYDGRTYIMYEAEVADSNLVVSGIVEKSALEKNMDGMRHLIALLFALFGVIMLFGAVLLFMSLEQLWSSALRKQRESLEKLVYGARERALAYMSNEVSKHMGTILDLDYRILDTARDRSVLNFAGAIRQAGMTLLSLIGSIVDFARIQTGKMEIVGEQYELATMINDLVKQAKDDAALKDLKFVINVNQDLPSKLYGDMVRIRQVVSNLIDNAFKFTPRGQVGLSVTGAISEDNTSVMLRFKVSDTGSGLTDEERERFFSQFSNPGTTGAVKHSKGLGLAICYNLLKLMHGFIDIQSLPGKGSVFTAAVPQQIVSMDPIGNFLEKARLEAKQHADTISGFSSPDARALVVDDNAMSVTLLTKLFGRSKLKSDQASNSDDALRLMRERHYDIIFMDEKLTGMNARELFSLERGMPDNKNTETPVILLSSDKTPGARSSALEFGFSDLILRPFDQASVDSALRHYLPKEKLFSAAVSSARYEEPAQSKNSAPQRFRELGSSDSSSDIFESMESRTLTPGGVPDLDFSRNATKSEMAEPDLSGAMILDVDGGMKFCNDSLELYMKFASTFCRMYADRKQKLDRACQIADWKNYSSLMHSLRTTSMSIGGGKLSVYAKSLENAAATIMAQGTPDSLKQQSVYYLNDHHERCMDLYNELVQEIHRSLNV